MLKPQDIVVALKLIRADANSVPPTYAQLSAATGLSASEAHAAVERGLISGLLRRDVSAPRKMPLANISALREFLIYGLKYVWPTERGPITRGMPTATSQETVARMLNIPPPVTPLIWPHPEGKVRGETVEPLYPKATTLCLDDPNLHEWLALIDIVRLKAGREATLAVSELERRLR